MPLWFWIIAVIILAASTISSFLLRPKFSSENKGPDPFDRPTIDETRPIMVLWGTAKIDNPAIIWFGDEIIKDWKDGPVTYAYSYHIGIAYGFCFGPVDDLEAVWYNENLMWSGSYVNKTGASGSYTDIGFGVGVNAAAFNTETATGETSLILNFPNLFGGIDSKKTGAEGGIYFWLHWNNGSTTQNADWYLNNFANHQDLAYRGYSYIVSRGPSQDSYRYAGYSGISGQLKKIAFRLRRCPDGGLGAATAYRIVNTSDANPVLCLYELYTNVLWGAGISTASFDDTSWTAAAQTCYNENLGVSWTWETSETIEEIQNQLLATMDGAVYTDLATGSIKIKLARADYNPNTVPVFDMSSAIEISEFARGALTEQVNEVRVEYVDRDNNFVKAVSTPAQDLAHIRQTATVNRGKAFYPVSTATNAQKLALRDLKASSAALYRGTLKLNRRGATLVPGDVFRFDWAAYGVSNLYMRVVSTQPGTLIDGRPIVRFVQDVFSLASAVYNGPPPTSWVDPSPLPRAPVASEIYCPAEGAPYFFTGAKVNPLIFVTPYDRAQLNFDVWAKIGSAPTSDGYTTSLSQVPYTPYGFIYNLSLNQPPENTSSGIDVIDEFGMSLLLKCTSDDIRYRGRNLFIVFDPASPTIYEIAAFENITYLGNERYRLTNIRRALCDTAVVYPYGWPDNHKIYFFGYGHALIDYETLLTNQTIYLKVRSRSPAGVSTDTTTNQSIFWTHTILNPCPPQDVKINSQWMPRALTIGTSQFITVAWKNRWRKNAPEGRITTQDEATQDMTGSNIVVLVNFIWIDYSIQRQKSSTTPGVTSLTYTRAEMQADLGGAWFPGSGTPYNFRIEVFHWDGNTSRYSAIWDIQMQLTIL